MTKTANPQAIFSADDLVIPNPKQLYSEREKAAAAEDWPCSEVEAALDKFMAAVAEHDWATIADMLTDDGRGGNATFGLFPKQQYENFMRNGLIKEIKSREVWKMIDGGRGLIRWHETIPGSTPEGGSYDYYGVVEFIYAGNGQFCYIHSLPDFFGLQVMYQRWRADGQHEIYGDIFPALSQELGNTSV